MKKVLLKLVGVLLSAAIFVPGTSVTSTAAPTAELSAVGEQAFTDLTTCLTSGKTKKLDVFYLIDNSGSLSYTDKQEVRTEVLANSIKELSNFKSQGVTVSYGVALFNTNVEPVKEWTTLEGEGHAQQIAELANNGNLGNWTDWEEGLRYAKRQLDSRTDACKMLIWFTDGGINPDGSSSSMFESLSRLCHPGITESSLGGSKNFGFMSDFKKSGISVFGVLFQNDESTLAHYQNAEKMSQAEAQDRLDFEHYLMSFLVPLIEGSGAITQNAGGYPTPLGDLQCSELTSDGFAPDGQPNGAFLNAQSPTALAFQFLKLESQIIGGSSVPIVDGKFTIKPGTAAFRVITPEGNWELNGPANSEIRANNGQPGPVQASTAAGVTKLDFATKNEIKYQGQWELDSASESAELFVYSGLTIDLDRDKVSQVIGNRDNTLTGRISRTANFADLPIDLSLYEKTDITLEVLKNGVRQPASGVKVELLDSGQLKIENFKPEQEEGELELWVSLDLGGDFQKISSRFTLSTVSAKAFAIPSSDVVKLTTLDGPEGVASGTIQVVGPTVGESSLFCLDGASLRTDDVQTAAEKIDRLDSFVWNFGGVVASADPVCFEILNGETKAIDVQVANTTQANSHVVSMRNMSSQAGASEFSAPIRFEFDTKTQSDPVVAAGVIIALLLLGLLIPLALLYLFNRLSTKFLPFENTQRAEFPIVLTGGLSPRILDGRLPNKDQPLVVHPQDFVAQLDQPASAEVSTGAGIAKGRVPLFPLLATWYEVQADKGRRVLTMKSGGEKNPKTFADGKSGELMPNMNENWLIAFDESDLLAGADQPLPGRLIVYSAMSSLAGYQARVNDVVQTPGIADRLTQIREAVMANQGKPERQKSKKRVPAESSSLSAVMLAPPVSSGISNPAPTLSAPVSPTPPSSGRLAPPPPPPPAS